MTTTVLKSFSKTSLKSAQKLGYKFQRNCGATSTVGEWNHKNNFINEEKPLIKDSKPEIPSSSRESLRVDLSSKRDHILKFIAVILQKTVMEKRISLE